MCRKYIRMRPERVRRRTCKRRPSRKYKRHTVNRRHTKSKKRTKKRTAGSDWKCPQTQTVRGHADRLREELYEADLAIDACHRNVRYLEEYVKNLEASVTRLEEAHSLTPPRMDPMARASVPHHM